jgi:predicted peptidase
MIEEVKTNGPLGMRCKFVVPTSEGRKPLLVFLHGIGEVGTNLEEVLEYGPLDQIEKSIDIGVAKDWIIVHPQNPSSGWTVAEIDEVIEFFINNYPVNEDQVFLMGVSLGGQGVWNYAQSPMHVKKLAAIVPICGGGNDPSKAQVLVDESIPGWAAHSVDDKTVPQTTTKRMVNAVNDLAGRSQILFSEYAMYGHSAWSYFLRPTYGVYEWLKYQKLSNRRSSKVDVILRAGQRLVIQAE